MEEIVNGLRLSLQLYLCLSLALDMGWLDWLRAFMFRIKHSLCYNGRDENVL